MEWRTTALIRSDEPPLPLRPVIVAIVVVGMRTEEWSGCLGFAWAVVGGHTFIKVIPLLNKNSM